MSTSVRDLIAWQQAMDLVEMLYKLTAKFPREEIYGLTSQARRAAVSVASNIAEGQGRNSTKEFVQFLGMAHGSLIELETQVLIALRLKYVEQPETDEVVKQIERVRRLINGLMQSFQKGKTAGNGA
jgi:four helix bundle protein